jgi:hypothetical protein
VTVTSQPSSDGRDRRSAAVFAYLCEPERGSERGAGWGILRTVAASCDCVAITSPESGAALRRFLEEHADLPIEVVAVGEPWWAAAAKRSRVGEFLVYLAWERKAREAVAHRVDRSEIDISVHATLSAFWLPSVATDLGLPSIWGPVGGAVTTPRRLWPLLGWGGVGVEVLDWLAVRGMSLLPSTRRTWRNATVRVAQNAETVGRLPRRLRAGTIVLNHALFHDLTPPKPRAANEVEREPYVAWVSPMESRKGPELAIRALAAASPDVRLVMAGDGPERSRIERIARELGVSDRVRFEGQVPHERALDILAGAGVALFTGLREEGGFALAEAMLLGTPVVVLANGGAATVGRSSTDGERTTLVEVRSLAETISSMGAAIDEHMQAASSDPSAQRAPLIDQAAAEEEFRSFVEVALSASQVGHASS